VKSKFDHLKQHVIELRKQGFSITAIEKQYGIARSTLSGWFRKIELTDEQRAVLSSKGKNRWSDASREKATRWHNEQKAVRILRAESEVHELLGSVDLNNRSIMEIALAMLYLGEGFKKNLDTGMGNSDPMILRFFLMVLLNVFSVPVEGIRCNLHLRADQASDVEKRYWSEQLDLPLTNFKQSVFDKRTSGRATYDGYHGVCVISCGRVAIQRKLVYLGRAYCKLIMRNFEGD
jgi:hypothetical protein